MRTSTPPRRAAAAKRSAMCRYARYCRAGCPAKSMVTRHSSPQSSFTCNSETTFAGIRATPWPRSTPDTGGEIARRCRATPKYCAAQYIPANFDHLTHTRERNRRLPADHDHGPSATAPARPGSHPNANDQQALSTAHKRPRFDRRARVSNRACSVHDMPLYTSPPCPLLAVLRPISRRTPEAPPRERISRTLACPSSTPNDTAPLARHRAMWPRLRSCHKFHRFSSESRRTHSGRDLTRPAAVRLQYSILISTRAARAPRKLRPVAYFEQRIPFIECTLYGCVLLV